MEMLGNRWLVHADSPRKMTGMGAPFAVTSTWFSRVRARILGIRHLAVNCHSSSFSKDYSVLHIAVFPHTSDKPK